MKRKDGGPTISDRRYTPTQIYQTGQLDRRTLLHKRYHIQRVVGQGGMGAVYQAKDLKRQGSLCAVKEMSLSMVAPGDQAQAIENFKIEAKILWGLDHANLPSLLSFFSEGSRYYLAMEYIDGLTLEELLERNNAPFSERRVLGWARQLCDVLEYLHSQKPPIIFRDMKPGNIMLTRGGQIKLIDFGIARFFRPTGTPDTQLLGTPGFAPPEQYGKAQTDERSDIYALGMTLFQLLTNTLSEKGFGLQDTRMINPAISPRVAHALERATALDPDARYETVGMFRRALFGEGTFVFENEDVATSPAELAELCSHFPEEAAEYLADGEIELWLHEIGENNLSRAAAQLRIGTADRQLAVEQFIRMVVGKSPQSQRRPPVQADVQTVKDLSDSAQLRGLPPRMGRKRTSPAQVSPRTLDFGIIHPVISSPLLITVSNPQGLPGMVHVTEPWIVIDQNQFGSGYTYINVRINATRLRHKQHYSGIVILSFADSSVPNWEVKVEVEVQDYTLQEKYMRRGKTVVPDLDDEEDEDDNAYPAGQVAFDPGSGMLQQGLPQNRYPPGMNGNRSREWDPWPMTPEQQAWQKQGLTYVAAFMLASLFYTLLASQIPVPPNPWFITVLCGIIPAATLGALLVGWKGWQSFRGMINRALTGMGTSLLLLAMIRLICQFFLRMQWGGLQLLLMLLCASLAATFGSGKQISKYIMDKACQTLAFSRQALKFASIGLGLALGYFLTVGYQLGLFALLAMLVGAGVVAALAWRADYLLN